ncbi:MAG TPA: phasin family protein [Anaerolineae bacterium]|nr:phasin family protein [Anaerolineae bacterium]
MTKTEAQIEEMAEQIQEEAKDIATPFLDVARKVLLASIGAWALAADEIEDFVSRLVDRGEIADKDGRKLVKDVLDRRREMSPIAQTVDQQMDRFLARLNVPTRADVDALNASIADLTRKIEEMKES